MSERYLLTADADKIQDFVFRSAHLQEVIGGSHLLWRFCKDGLEALDKHYREKKYKDNWERDKHWGSIVNDGGRFLLWFAQKEKANEFARDLRELYQRAIQGTLTVVVDDDAYDPDTSGEFELAAQRVKKELQRAKLSSCSLYPSVHLPQTAFCASCGVALAIEHARLYENEIYLCPSCIGKRDERKSYLEGSAATPEDEDVFFINRFRNIILKNHADLTPEQLWRQTDAVDAIGKFDPRAYVAYLVADGNSMGDIFEKCNESNMRELSDKLPEIIYNALSAPMGLLKKLLDESYGENLFTAKEDKQPKKLGEVLPVVPLILGGDDIFVLMPAPYAVDFTRRFIQKYEETMSAFLEDLKQNDPFLKDSNFPKPTLSAVIVICKSNYPYKLAHRHGEERLKQAKRMAKTADSGLRSVIDVEVILSSERRGATDPQKAGLYRASLRPFWAKGDANEYGLPIQNLIKARKELAQLAGKRRAQLKALYLQLPGEKRELQELWDNKLKRILLRIGRMEADDTDGQRAKVEKVLQTLGDPDEHESLGHWRKKRGQGDDFYGHALPDLLQMWDYCYDLEELRTTYE